LAGRSLAFTRQRQRLPSKGLRCDLMLACITYRGGKGISAQPLRSFPALGLIMLGLR